MPIQYCCHRVYVAQSMHDRGCARAGRFEENGKHYCRQHLPSNVKKRDDERSKRWKDEREAKRALETARRLVADKEQEVIARARITIGNCEIKKLRKTIEDLDRFLEMVSKARSRLHELNKGKK